LEQLAFAEKINAAVAYVGDAEGAIAETRRNEGGAHPGSVFVFVGIGQNGVIRLFHGFGQKACPYGSIAQVGVILNAAFPFMEKGQHSFDGDTAGDFSGGMTAHAVTYYKYAQPLVETKVIFI
jgi:hypothetical protein